MNNFHLASQKSTFYKMVTSSSCSSSSPSLLVLNKEGNWNSFLGGLLTFHFRYFFRGFWFIWRSLSWYQLLTAFAQYLSTKTFKVGPDNFIWRSEVRLLSDREFLQSVFTILIWLKNLSIEAFEHGAQKQSSAIKKILFHLRTFLNGFNNCHIFSGV